MNDQPIKTIAIIYKTTEAVPMIIEERHLEMVRKAIPGVEIHFTQSEDEMIAKDVNADVLMAWGRVSPAKYCQFATNLRWIFVFSAGVERVMVPEVLDLNIRISSAKGIHGLPMADHVIGFILSFLRGFPSYFTQQKNKTWKLIPYSMQEIVGKTVGIFGMGEIGKVVAKRCKALDMRVLGVKRTPAPMEFVDKVYPSGDCDEVLRESDFIVILLPLTPDTVHYFDRAKLSKMKKSAVLINVGRGQVVDEQALIECLQESRIAGAALDATEVEPLPQDSPLWLMPNVLITPHCAAVTPHYMDRAFDMFCRNIERFYRGERLISEVDTDARY